MSRRDGECDGPQIEGYLYKKSSGRVQRWQKRYFTLNPPLLTQSGDQDSEPSRSIDLRKVHFVREKNPRNPKDGGFEIGHGHRLLHLRATTADDCLRWLRMIQSAVAPHQAIGTALSQINEDAACDDEEEPEPVEKYGAARRHSDAYQIPSGWSPQDDAVSTSGSSTAASDVDSLFFGNDAPAQEDEDEVSLYEDMRDRIKDDLNNRLPLHLLENRALPGSLKKVPCSTAGSTLQSYVIRGEDISNQLARDRFTYALIGVLNFASLMLRRQFVSVCTEMKHGSWMRLPGATSRCVPIRALAAQVNDCLYFALIAKRLQAKKSPMLCCFEAFEKAFLALVNEACKLWAEHFRGAPNVKPVFQKLWLQLDGPDFFDCLCKDARRYCDKEAVALILPEAFPYLEIQIVRRGLIHPMLTEMLRNAPLRKISVHWSTPNARCNHLAAGLLKQHVKSIETVFKPSKSTSKQMGVTALNDVREFLIGDAPVLQQLFLKLHEAYQPDFSLSHAHRLLAWRTDLSLATRQEVMAEFRSASDVYRIRRADTTKEFMKKLLPTKIVKHGKLSSGSEKPAGQPPPRVHLERAATLNLERAEKKVKELVKWARTSSGLGAAA